MKQFDKMAAQGDLLIRKIDALPVGLVPEKPEGDHYIVAHSETGHHHVLPRLDVQCFAGPDPLVSYAEVMGDSADLIHQRPFHTHEGITLGKGVYELRRQREYTPEGFRRVQD